MTTPLVGVNVAGAEWRYLPDVQPDYQWVSYQDIDYLAEKGITFLRLIFSWEILQPSLYGDFDGNYLGPMSDLIDYAVSKNMSVMIEPHGGASENFARYKGNPIGSQDVPNEAFADLWSRLGHMFKGDPFVVFGLMNEPNNMSTAQWFDAAQAAITAIRDSGASNMIMAPGNGFSQPATWNQNFYDTTECPDSTSDCKFSNADLWGTLNDPLNNIAVSVHTYFDQEGGGVDTGDIVNLNIIGERLATVVDWARPKGIKVHLSEFGASYDATVETGDGDAKQAVKNAIDYMNANSDVIIGWSWWAYGPPKLWGDYPFTLCPTNDYTVDDPKMAWLTPYFNVPSTPKLRLDRKSETKIGNASALKLNFGRKSATQL